MVDYDGDTITIKLEYFTREDIQNGLLEIMKYVFYQQENVSFDWEQQRGYYILIEILLATLREKDGEDQQREGQ